MNIEYELLAMRCELEAMLAENTIRAHASKALAYNDEAFFALADRIKACGKPCRDLPEDKAALESKIATLERDLAVERRATEIAFYMLSEYRIETYGTQFDSLASDCAKIGSTFRSASFITAAREAARKDLT